MKSNQQSYKQESQQEEPLLNQSTFLKIEDINEQDFMIPVHDHTFVQSHKRNTTNQSSSRKESAKNSTAKYRERKKKELSDLEEMVRAMELDLADTNTQIQEVKQKIFTALQSLAKMVVHL